MRGPVVHLSRAPGAGCGSAEPVRAALLLLVAMQQPTTGQGRAPRSRATSALGTALLLRDAGVRSRSAPRPDPDPRTGNRPLPPMAEGLIDERTRRTSARFGAERRLRWLREARMPQSPRDGCPLRRPRPIRTECSLAELGIDMTRFAGARHLASWPASAQATISPPRQVSTSGSTRGAGTSALWSPSSTAC